MFSIHQKFYNNHLLLLLFILLISLSCYKAQDNITPPLPEDPSIKCDTCPCDTCPEPQAPPPLPPPPPPPVVECPPPPPPPCPPPPSPPPAPKEPPCDPCMTKPPPPPRFYYSPGNSNLYVTEYNYSRGTRAKIAMSIVMMVLVGFTLFDGIIFL